MHPWTTKSDKQKPLPVRWQRVALSARAVPKLQRTYTRDPETPSRPGTCQSQQQIQVKPTYLCCAEVNYSDTGEGDKNQKVGFAVTY